MNDAELEGFRPNRYFARSWALLTRDRGWIKPVLVMFAALLVPVVGMLGVMGYVAEWARLTAWGVNAAPKQKGVRVGACIASGWRVFVVTLVWNLGSALVSAVLGLIPLIGPLLAFVWMVCSLFLGIVIMVAALRATIYQKIVAGLRVPTVWQMVRSDVGGLMRILGMQIAAAAVLWLASAVFVLLALVNVVPQLIYFADYVAEFDAIMSASTRMAVFFQMIVTMLTTMGPWMVVLSVVSGICGIVMMMLGYTATGLWMRQFNVAAWGRDEDPLPGSAPQAQPEAPAPAQGQTVPTEAEPSPTEPSPTEPRRTAPAEPDPSPVDAAEPEPPSAGPILLGPVTTDPDDSPEEGGPQ